MWSHSFNVELAANEGVEMAIFFNEFDRFLTYYGKDKENVNNEQLFYLFPYWEEDIILNLFEKYKIFIQGVNQ